jgi:hypothetical protein
MLVRTGFNRRMFFVLVLLILVFGGCQQAQQPDVLTGPSHIPSPEVSLKIFQRATVNSKVTAVNISAQGVDEHGNPIGGSVAGVNIQDPEFPLDAQLRVFVPPCTYRVTVVATFEQGPPRIGEANVNACQRAEAFMSIDEFSERS